MNKKGLLLVLALMAGAVAAHASSYTSSGCGFGSILFKGKSGKTQLVLASFTNGIFSNQTFGITSETLGCTSDGVVKNEQKLEMFASVNFQKISKEMAQGGGEYLNGLSSLMGCKDAGQKQAFFKLAQTRYEKILPSAGTDSASMIRNLRVEMASDPALSIL